MNKNFERAKFYAALRKRESGVFGTSLSQSQVDGIEAILSEAIKRKTPLEYLAYIFATAYHEVGGRMQPVREGFASSDRSARRIVSKRRYGRPDGPYGHVYYGRGFVQLTWLANYERASKEIGTDFVKNPDLVMQLRHAVEILFTGMEHGWFTARKLSDYLPGDYRHARRIINGMDKAGKIAGHARAFEAALDAANYPY